MRLRWSFAWRLLLLVGGGKFFATQTAPEKQPVASTESEILEARSAFWEAFSAGDYAQVPAVSAKLSAAYLKNPNDPDTAMLLGFLHFWALAESKRSANEENTVTVPVSDHAVLGEHYFSQAIMLRPVRTARRRSADEKRRGRAGETALRVGETGTELRKMGVPIAA